MFIFFENTPIVSTNKQPQAAAVQPQVQPAPIVSATPPVAQATTNQQPAITAAPTTTTPVAPAAPAAAENTVQQQPATPQVQATSEQTPPQTEEKKDRFSKFAKGALLFGGGIATAALLHAAAQHGLNSGSLHADAPADSEEVKEQPKETPAEQPKTVPAPKPTVVNNHYHLVQSPQVQHPQEHEYSRVVHYRNILPQPGIPSSIMVGNGSPHYVPSYERPFPYGGGFKPIHSIGPRVFRV